jgi:predicted DNA-binding WGR domain protein
MLSTWRLSRKDIISPGEPPVWHPRRADLSQRFILRFPAKGTALLLKHFRKEKDMKVKAETATARKKEGGYQESGEKSRGGGYASGKTATKKTKGKVKNTGGEKTRMPG